MEMEMEPENRDSSRGNQNTLSDFPSLRRGRLDPYNTRLGSQIYKAREQRDPELNKILDSTTMTLADLLRYNFVEHSPLYYLPTNLARTDGSDENVPSDVLKGKKVGLYFSCSHVPDCEQFARVLLDMYTQLSEKGDFEIVVSGCALDKSFSRSISRMGCLCVPFSNEEKRRQLSSLFLVSNRPVLVIIDENGHLVTDLGVDMVRDYGAEAYPFTTARLDVLKEEEEEAKNNQSLQSILASQSRHFVISSGGDHVSITELEGQFVGLYFSEASSESSPSFTAKLKEFYNELKAKGESFEIVTIPLEDEDEPFRRELDFVPWLSLPFKDKSRWKLYRYFEVSAIPTLVIIGPDGKTVHPNAVDAVKDYGELAFPFTAKRFSELKMRDKMMHEAKTLESLFVSGDLDFVIRSDGSKVPVSSLAGKHVLLYFSSQSCESYPCLTEDLTKAFESIKRMDDAFEVISIFHDADKCSFDQHLSKMSSWLALPFGDERKQSLCGLFKGTPQVVAFGPAGRFLTAHTLEYLELYCAEAYPFTEKHIEKIEKQFAEALNKWPEKVKHPLHDHELVRSPAPEYICDGCERVGKECAFKCKKCCYFRHPKCALGL